VQDYGEMLLQYRVIRPNFKIWGLLYPSILFVDQGQIWRASATVYPRCVLFLAKVRPDRYNYIVVPARRNITARPRQLTNFGIIEGLLCTPSSPVGQAQIWHDRVDPVFSTMPNFTSIALYCRPCGAKTAILTECSTFMGFCIPISLNRSGPNLAFGSRPTTVYALQAKFNPDRLLGPPLRGKDFYCISTSTFCCDAN